MLRGRRIRLSSGGGALEVGVAGGAVREPADLGSAAGRLGHGLLGRHQTADDVQTGQGLLVEGQLLHLLEMLLHAVLLWVAPESMAGILPYMPPSSAEGP